MRLAAQVFAAYALLLIVGALWRLGPFERAIPDLVALFAIYLGLSARVRVAPAMLAAVLMGYLADLIMGAPAGLLAVDAGLICLIGHFVQGRLIVRGRIFTMVFSAAVGLASGLILFALRAWFGRWSGALGSELWTLFLSVLATGLVGPLVFGLCRRVDGRFARTQRERDAALEGRIP
jgi:rod shape-determining protein MreD